MGSGEEDGILECSRQLQMKDLQQPSEKLNWGKERGFVALLPTIQPNPQDQGTETQGTLQTLLGQALQLTRLRGPKGGADRVPSALDTNSPFLSSLGTQCSLENLQTPEISETQAAQSHLGLSGRARGARKGRSEVGEEEKPATLRKPALPLCFGT